MSRERGTIVESRWARKHAFSEYADALNLDTSQIMATVESPETGLHTLFYIDPPGSTDVWSVGLLRDENGIMRRVIGPDRQEGMWEEIMAWVQRQMEKKFGPPKP